ncbi:MAG: hypothetical protein K2X38_24030 [Gemmataceae bacterium]|nr:hypothetical protein [Gemmataceae bacterium]
MTLPRRRIIRPTPIALPTPKLERLGERLAAEEKLLHRWMSRLRRAFHAVEKQQRTIARLRKSILNAEALA